ncbi:glycosyltransferase family 2 protein [Desulfovibrio sp. Huiquan2017]|uniref:glycosyltransferase family 2 protein n=1 Tax=Desulfovibrio sp. Huiquan2017 TaxID=2816861 RepID=UPI001A92FAA0|nr:glycosyltransferase family 2 protein [Desulfovibrio sp. Huiquan2017]
MKLIIQIPCLNEAGTLDLALSKLPKEVPGFDCVEWLVIDDGSTDDTVNVAKANGVDHIISHPQNLGLARAFMTGITASLSLGADVIINTDADDQYDASCIPDLVRPILDDEAEIVIGTRPIHSIEHFSPLKKIFQKIGSAVVRLASNTNVGDAPSGFRAISRSAALQLNVFSEYTYTLETIIQAGMKRMKVVSVPVRVNKDLRPSRLVHSIPSYIYRSILTIIRISITYKPLKFFAIIGMFLFAVGLMLNIRWLFLFFNDPSHARVPSLILGLTFIIGSFFSLAIGILGDLLSVNRRLLEDIRTRLLSHDMGHRHD